MLHNHACTKLACLILLAVTLVTATSRASAQTRNPMPTPQQQSSVRIRWSGEQGVSRYRLQLARDEAFTDIVFDRAVVGREYLVTELPPGKYFWRVAPAASETGRYSRPAPVQINNASVVEPLRPTPTRAAVIVPPANVGWRTATGNVVQPMAAHLRDTSVYDLVGVNADGTVFALNGTNGVALWTARFRPQARRGEATGNNGATAFAPVIVSAPQGLANTVVAFDGGVRELEGATGRELWRMATKGRAASGVAFDLNGDGTPEIVIADDSTPSLIVLSSDTGKVVSQTILDGTVVGTPVALNAGSERNIVLALANGMIDVHDMSGKRVRSIKLDASITTAPLVVQTARGAFLTIGTDKGLIALNGADLKPVWRVKTEASDAPRGTLAAADLDNDGVPEVVMITRSGRVVVISLASGKIKWFVPGAIDAESAAFADLNGDGSLDVLVAAGPTFALGLDGRSDGTTIWRADEAVQSRSFGSSNTGTSGRRLVVAPVGANAAFIIGSDPAHTGLRAFGLPTGAVRTADR